MKWVYYLVERSVLHLKLNFSELDSRGVLAYGSEYKQAAAVKVKSKFTYHIM